MQEITAVTQQKEPVTIMTGCAIENDYLFLACKPDRVDGETEFSRVYFYDAQNTRTPWVHHDLPDWSIVSVCTLNATASSPRQYCALSKHGDVAFQWPGGQRVEHIDGAGLRRTTLPIYGYVMTIRAIGAELFVCGSGGQVYRRTDDCWLHIAPSLRLPALAPTAADAAWRVDAGSREFADIDGASPDDVYVVGGAGDIHHYDGTTWKACLSASRSALHCVRAGSATDVWICGADSTLLRGNHVGGFAAVGSCRESRRFTSLGRFNGAIYLAAEDGLFQLCDDQQIRRVTTGLSPEISDAHVIDVRDGVLWSFGYTDIARFDGRAWSRLLHPDHGD